METIAILSELKSLEELCIRNSSWKSLSCIDFVMVAKNLKVLHFSIHWDVKNQINQLRNRLKSLGNESLQFVIGSSNCSHNFRSMNYVAEKCEWIILFVYDLMLHLLSRNKVSLIDLMNLFSRMIFHFHLCVLSLEKGHSIIAKMIHEKRNRN